MLKKLQKLVWKEDGDSPQDSTLAYSEMPGELDKFKEIKYTQEQKERLEKAMNAPIDHEALRKTGL